jgi:hypothetical protein
MLDEGMDPADLAAEIETAVRRRRLYVLTGDEWTPLVRERMERFVTETEAIARSVD